MTEYVAYLSDRVQARYKDYLECKDDLEVPETVGNRLRKYRAEAGYQCAEFARLVNYSKDNYYSLESGNAQVRKENPVHVGLIERVAKVLGIEPSLIWEGE